MLQRKRPLYEVQQVTLQLKILTDHDPELRTRLKDTMYKYTYLCNFVSDIVFNTWCSDKDNVPQRITNIDIHNLKIVKNQSLYKYLREYCSKNWGEGTKFGGFPSTLMIQIFKDVARSYNTIITKYHNSRSFNKKKKLLIKPCRFKDLSPVAYNKLTMNFQVFDPMVSNNIGYGTLSTSVARTIFNFTYGEQVRKHLMRRDATTGQEVAPWELDEYIKSYKEQHDQRPMLLKHELKSAKLIYRRTSSRKRRRGTSTRGEFFLHVTLNKEVPLYDSSHSTCLGVDLGITNLATTSNGTRFGGEQVDKIRVKHHRHRQGLQKAAKQLPSKRRNRIYRKIRKVGSKEQRFHRNLNHIIAKQLVAEAQRTCSNVIVLENLKGIRERLKARRQQRARMHGWSYHQLKEFILYKAKMAGIRVILIDPRHTSQRCNACGHIERSNRGSGAKREQFRCKACSHEAHADINAAMNIRDLGQMLAAA